MYKLYQGDCLKVMHELPDQSIDLTVTSPPYDNLRTYKGNNDQWCDRVWMSAIENLYRLTKAGGVVVWIVNDATVKGSETGCSFRQALHAKEIGFNLHDTMIWNKTSTMPCKSRRYQPTFEYMFVFSKGRPTFWNPLQTPCSFPGKKSRKSRSGPCGWVSNAGQVGITKEFKTKSNVWLQGTSSTEKNRMFEFKHPAKAPVKLMSDHIRSWSDQGCTVLDPFMGSGTTGVAARNLARYFIGIELDAGYFKIARDRIDLDV